MRKIAERIIEVVENDGRSIKYITNQKYLNPQIVDRKIEELDFEVLVSPPFIVGDHAYSIVIDGHHSFGGALKSGNPPKFVQVDEAGLLDGDSDYFEFKDKSDIPF